MSIVPQEYSQTTNNFIQFCSSSYFPVCENGWYLHQSKCIAQCPWGTYIANSQEKNVCAMCHYSCMTCYGPSDADCTACHDDSSLVSVNLKDYQCVIKSLEWTIQSTKWFYFTAIILGMILLIVTSMGIYMCIGLNRDNAIGGYEQVSLVSSDEQKKDKISSQRNSCVSDSD